MKLLTEPFMPRSAAMTLIAGSVIASARRAVAQTSPPAVRIGALTIDACIEAYAGDDRGIFLAGGITPQISTLTNGATIIAAVLAGDLDVGIANPMQVASAVARGIPLQMIAPAALYSKKDANPNFMVAKTSSLKEPKDVIGATIGIATLGDFNQLSLLAWLDSNHVPRTSVRFVELPNTEMGAGLVRGTVQLAILTEPAKTDALRAGLIRSFGDTYIAIAAEFATTVWFTTKGWIQKNPDTAKKLVNGIYAAARWVNANSQQAGDILAKVAKMDPAVVAAMHRDYFATVNDRKYVEGTLALAARYGMLQRPITFEEYAAF